MRTVMICAGLVAFWPLLSGLGGAALAADEHSGVLGEARRRIDAGRYREARDILRPYLDAPSAKSEEVEYLIALLSFAEPDPAAPEISIRAFVKRRPFSEFAPIALYRLAQYFQTDVPDPVRSIRAYSDYFMSYPEHRLSDKARLGYISALIEAGDYRRAKVVISQAGAIHDYAGMDRESLERFREIVEEKLDEARPKPARKASSAPARKTSVSPSPAAPISPASYRDPAGQSSSAPAQAAAVDRPEVARALPRAFVPPDYRPKEEPSPQSVTRTTREVIAPPRQFFINPYILVSFRNTPLDDVLTAYSQELGITFKKAGDVDCKITMTPKPRLLSGEQAMSLLQAALDLKGYAMVGDGATFAIAPKTLPSRANTRFFRVGSSPGTKKSPAKPAQPPAPAAAVDPSLSSQPADESPAPPGNPRGVILPDEDGIEIPYPRSAPPVDRPSAARTADAEPESPIQKMTDDWVKIYSLAHAEAERLDRFLQTLIDRGIDSGALPRLPIRSALIRADRMSNSLVVVGPPAVQEAIESLIAKLDYEGFSEFQIVVIPLKYARSAEMAAKFRSIVSWENQTRADSGVLPILIQADDRMNALLISSSSQRLMRMFTDLSAELDKPIISPSLKPFRSLSDISSPVTP